ncbi:NAD(P)H-hydrate dehydratase [bacterium]|nr:NAD(P)H-hydrate dehydratase [bacterium]
MRKIATAREMQSLDSAAIEQAGIPGILLMENASLEIMRKTVEIFDGEIAGRDITIVCGKGNNGGDGYAVARHLLNRGAEVLVIALGKIKDLRGDALTNAQIFTAIGGRVLALSPSDSMPNPPEADIIIDALLGTGIDGPVRGRIAEMIEWINDRPEPVLAVDIPSGVNGDTGAVEGPAIIADWTVTMGLLKRGLVLPPGRDLCGEISVAIISLPPRIKAGKHIPFNMLEAHDIRNMLPNREPTAHKGDCGRALAIAGSPGMTGAAALCSRAALRIGSGLVILGVPHSLNPVMEAKVTEVMTRPLAENEHGCLHPEAMQLIEELILWSDAAALGPGLGQHPDTKQLLFQILADSNKPLVIDADGLNLLGSEEDFAGSLPSGTILTPHPGEFSRLSGMSINDILAQRVDLISEKAQAWGAVIVLKGSPTVIADPGGEVYCNPTGNPALATAGSGDVLTGMILGLLAQGCPPVHAACAGVYLHGLAGDLAAEQIGIAATVAGDLDTLIPKALRMIKPES